MTYLAFRDRVANIRRNTTCDCSACRAIPSLDLHARYQELSEARREFVSPEEADQVNVREVAATPIELWVWLNDAEKRLRWESYEDNRPTLRPGGSIVDLISFR